MVETFAALAEPNRLRIIELLRTGAQPVAEITARLRLQQPQVSKHLRVLRESGLVTAEVRAQQRLYALRAEPLRELDTWLARYRDLWLARLDQLDELLAQRSPPSRKANR